MFRIATSGDSRARRAPRGSVLAACGLATAVLIAAAPLTPGEAHGHVTVGIGLGVAPWPYYAPPPAYLYPPPAYYVPPAYYAPPPVYYAPPAPPVGAAPRCREYHGDASIDASGEPFYGTACLWPDGQWHIAN